MQLKVKKLHPDAILPKYQTEGAACFDLHAIEGRASAIMAMSPQTFRTGLAFEIPAGYVMLIYSRSGHGFKNDTRLANCVGVIDSDYRGEVQVKLTRDIGETDKLSVKPGDRIAQALIVHAPPVQIIEVGSLSSSERGASGFGSTGQ